MSNKQKIHIGTSGWNYNHWSGPFYPKDLPQKKWLEFYRERFHTVEINNSFYQLPKASTFETWRTTVPSDFRFAVKASRYITHMKKLKQPAEAVSNFMNRIESLGDKADVVLFQLPPKWKFNGDRLRSFFNLLPDTFRYTFEFRDSTWWNDETFEILNEHNAAFCIFELAGKKTPTQVTTDFIYIRLHGPGAAYEGSYGDNTLSQWAEQFSEWQDQGKEIYCYFDNDQNGYAAQNALKLQELVHS